MHLLRSKGQSFRYSPGWGNPHTCLVVVYLGQMSKREQCLLLSSWLAFSHFLRYPPANWAFLGLIPGWVVLCNVLGPYGPLQWTLLRGWEFLLPPQPSQVFTVRGFEALLPCSGTPGCVVCLTPQLFLPVYLHVNVGLPDLPAAVLPAHPKLLSTGLPQVLSTLAACLHPSYWSGWMFLLYLLGCQASMQFNFLSFWLFLFLNCCVSSMVYLPMPPSWLKVSLIVVLICISW